MQPIRRKQILDATFDSVAERSLESTRMRQIADTAGISQSSLHYYFHTKDKLIVALLDRLLVEFKEGREERLAIAGGAKVKLRVMLEDQKQIIAEKSSSLEVYYDFWVQATKQSSVHKKIQDMYSSWREDLQDILNEGVAQGDFLEDRIAMAPVLLVSLFQGAALQNIIDPDSFDLDEYFEEFERLIMCFLVGESADLEISI